MAITASGLYYNDPKPVTRGDYGVRVARKGFDATSAGDTNLLFNSGWRVIQIVKVVSEADKIIAVDESNQIQDEWFLESEDTYGMRDYNIAVDEKWVYLPMHESDYRDLDTGELHVIHQQYKIYHGLGYVPMFFKSKDVAGVDGYYLLTNIDIRQDVDYPYTSKPSYYYGNTSDYGIKSKASNRKNFPTAGDISACGINTQIQSKLVMAVKTELTTSADKETSGSSEERRTICAWAMPQDENTQSGSNLLDYECFAFYGGNVDNVEGQFVEAPVNYLPFGATSEELKSGIYTFAGNGDQYTYYSPQSLVIIRQPMVAPDVEEITIE